VVHQIPAVAKSDASVLISGETGTGKELLSRAVHYSSDRASYPFVAVNCGSLVETLLEDEFFGHERGAFTGALCQKSGVLTQAHRGTLFLDEVNTLSAMAQIDLLRVVQERKFRAIGSQRDQAADIRIVAATNTQLDQLVHSGSFRADLYYRLSVFWLHLPPLRERKEDIVLLAAHFLDKHALSKDSELKLSSSACEALLAWHWPGNVRELENAIIRAVHFAGAGSIETPDLRLPANAKPTAEAGPDAF
jgi:Nif-specific regulatory protein